MMTSIKNFLKGLPQKIRKIPLPVLIGCGAAAAAILIGLGIFAAVHEFGPTVLKGIDISHYQGNISWKAVAKNGKVKFVYIKATEGETYQDPLFSQNLKAAQANGIRTGAYHFYSQSSSGKTQAENFISVVPKKKGMLPPAIDIEGSATKQADFKSELTDYINLITSHYGQKPVFYVPDRVYNMLYDDFSQYRFWIIDLSGKPIESGYSFWQYSNKGKLAGIDGNVDMDQYQGSLWNFKKLFIR